MPTSPAIRSAGATACVAIAVTLGLGVRAARASDDLPPTEPPSPLAGPNRKSSIGLGLMGVVGATFLDAPSDQSVTVAGVRSRPLGLADDAGFEGLSAGGGLALELRAFRYVGLELDLIRSRDSGSAELTVSRFGVEQSFAVEISDVAWHVPLLAKAVLPTDWVRPFLLVGPEIVLPESAEASVEGELPYAVEYRANARSYWMLTAGLGAEVLLPIPDLDVRIPLQLRGSWAPSVGESRDDRALYVGQDALHVERVVYHTRWHYQAVVTLGAMVHF